MAIYEWCYTHDQKSSTEQNLHLTSPGAYSLRKARYLLPAAILTIASALTSLGTDDIRSTHICPHSAGGIVPFFQISETLLDSFALINIETVVRRMKANYATADAAVPKVVGSILIVSQLAIENPLV